VASSTHDRWCFHPPQNLLEKPWSHRKQFCGFSHDSDCLPINGCGVPWAAQLYYQSFTLLITNIFMGLFAVFILEGFAVADREASAVLSKAHLHAFQQVWQKYDPQGHGLVHFKELRDIIRALPPPLGFQGTRPTERQLRQLFKRMPVRLYRRSMVTFWEVAKYLAIIVYEDDAKRKDDSFLPAGSKLLDVETQVCQVKQVVIFIPCVILFPSWTPETHQSSEKFHEGVPGVAHTSDVLCCRCHPAGFPDELCSKTEEVQD
jgi:Voltage-dependent L-type calcium channel, IQ-associated